MNHHMPMKKRATRNIIVLKRGAHVLNSAFNHMKLIGELPPSLIQTSDNKQDSMKCSPNIMKVVIQLKDSPERQSHEAVKLSSPPQQHNSRPRNQLLDHRRHRYHRNLCYRLQATSPSSLFEIFLGDVRVMSFVRCSTYFVHASADFSPFLDSQARLEFDRSCCHPCFTVLQFLFLMLSMATFELRIVSWFFFSIFIPTSSQVFYVFFDTPVVIRIQLPKFSPAAQKSSIG